MSWSFNATGKPQAVVAKAKQEFARISCAEPEETARQNALTTICKLLEAMPASSAVNVSASGSQSAQVDGTFLNNLNLQIQPIYGFIE